MTEVSLVFCQNQIYLTKHVILSPFNKFEKCINTRELNKAFINFFKHKLIFSCL